MGVYISIIAIVLAAVFGAIGLFKEIPATGRFSLGTKVSLVIFGFALVFGIFDLIWKDGAAKTDKEDIINTTQKTGDSVRDSIARAKKELIDSSGSNRDSIISGQKKSKDEIIDSLKNSLRQTANEIKTVREHLVALDLPLVDIYPLPNQPNPIVRRRGLDTLVTHVAFRNDGAVASEFHVGFIYLKYADGKIIWSGEFAIAKANESMELQKAPDPLWIDNTVTINNIYDKDTILIAVEYSYLDSRGKRHQPKFKLFRFTLGSIGKSLSNANFQEYETAKDYKKSMKTWKKSV